jgi:hypothetical protein
MIAVPKFIRSLFLFFYFTPERLFEQTASVCNGLTDLKCFPFPAAISTDKNSKTREVSLLLILSKDFCNNSTWFCFLKSENVIN